jgi:hypothetical protein
MAKQLIFYDDGTANIAKTVSNPRASIEFEAVDFFDIEASSEIISKYGFKKVNTICRAFLSTISCQCTNESLFPVVIDSVPSFRRVSVNETMRLPFNIIKCHFYRLRFSSRIRCWDSHLRLSLSWPLDVQALLNFLSSSHSVSKIVVM